MTIPASGCSLANTTCQCSNTRLVKTTAACMMANCTLAETLGTYISMWEDGLTDLLRVLALNKIQAAICQRPYESQNQKIRIMTIVTAVFTNTAALLRFVTRISLHQTMGLDDLFIAGAVVSCAIHYQENSSNRECPRFQKVYSLTSVYNVFTALIHDLDDA